MSQVGHRESWDSVRAGRPVDKLLKSPFQRTNRAPDSGATSLFIVEITVF